MAGLITLGLVVSAISGRWVPRWTLPGLDGAATEVGLTESHDGWLTLIPTWQAVVGAARRAVRRDVTLSLFGLALVVLTHLPTEKVQTNGQFGEGALFGIWATDFQRLVLFNGVTEDASQSPALRCGGRIPRATLVPGTAPTVVAGFVALNVALLGSMMWTWLRITHLLGMSVAGRWLGVVGLFINFAVLKWSAFTPVLPDMPAYATALWLFWLWSPADAPPWRSRLWPARLSRRSCSSSGLCSSYGRARSVNRGRQRRVWG